MSRHWTEKTDREADALFRTLSVAEIRRRQDLADQQIRLAYTQRNTDALTDLNAMRDALSREMMRRSTARERRAPVLGGLRIEQQNTGWVVVHDESGLGATPGLRQRRFAEQARDDLLATGVDFTRDKQAVSADRKLWAEVYWRWQQRAKQTSYDDTTFEYYSPDTKYGTFIPSAQWAAAMRAAVTPGSYDSEAVSRLLNEGNKTVAAALREQNRYRARDGDADTGCQHHGRITGCFGRWNNCLPYETRPELETSS